jgi:hypothetical protein
MKKIFVALFAVAFVSSLCFAQQPPAPVSQTAKTPVETKTFTGKVDSVSIGDIKKGSKSEIVVIDDKGQKMNFRVKSGIPITTKDGTTLTLSSITKGSKVAVEYTTGKMGTYKAQSIKLVE